ncbi:metallo-hydrolase/oxidoreductase superfamily protein isoform X2 [Wolffia australiana]
MAVYRLACVFKASSSSASSPGGGDGEEEEILVVRQAAPPVQEEYEQYVDSDLWDLPSAPLKMAADGAAIDAIVLEKAEDFSRDVDLMKFDLRSAVEQVMIQVGIPNAVCGRWVCQKLVEEPDFGPGSAVHTLFILGVFDFHDTCFQDVARWISPRRALKLLKEVNRCGDRIGPLFVTMFFSGSSEPKWKTPDTGFFQEYPPGVYILPMKSKTPMPFRTTNLVIVEKYENDDEVENCAHVTYGDALLVDPGCFSEVHAKLKGIVAALPRRLLIFVTHHHQDHVNGLSVIQKCNPDALLLAHENTLDRIGKDTWSGDSIKVSNGHKISIGRDQLQVIFAPGHTNGHAALLHVSSNSLIVGDHCVGQGSAVLDYRAGGNMKDYFETTYKFLELSPHVLIPMHGRINCWPKRMLCGYLKHRREREQAVLEAINSGAQSLFDILTKSYADVDPKFWLAASSNVRLHVEHLLHQGKLPLGFSRERFLKSCGAHFLGRWVCGPLMVSMGTCRAGMAFLASLLAAMLLSYIYTP